MKSLASYLGSPRATSLTHSGFLPTTVIATPDGWRSASSILPGDLVSPPGGIAVRVHDVQMTSIDPYESDAEPIYIPSYALGNLTDMTVLPDQVFKLSKNILGVQHTTHNGQVKARNLIGLNGIRTCDTDDMPTAITLTFERETVICCAHGSFAVCSQTQNTHTNEFGPLLTA